LHSPHQTDAARERAVHGGLTLLPAFFLMLIALLVAAPAGAETRVLKVINLHTRESGEIAFKRDGRYLPDGLRKLNYILRDWRKNETITMDPRLFDLIWTVYQKTGSHEYINVVCGYRSPGTNAMLRSRSRGVAQKSQHMLGKAMDFFIPGVPLAKLRAIGLKMQVGGVGYYPTSGSPFVHMDVGSVRHWPRMSRQQLLALFPDGRTLHIPSDGKPLPGYEQALADYRQRNGAPPSVMVASAERKHKGFFASLFGGGADEAEDESEATSVATAAPAPAKEAAPSSSPPGVELASLSAGKGEMPKVDAPALPDKAPRPDVDVGAQSPELAMAVPLPTWRPDYTPEKVQPVAVVAAAPAAATRKDQIIALLKREGARLKEAADRAGGPMQAYAAPLPTARPETATIVPAVAALPQPRPEFLPESRSLSAIPAVLTQTDSSGKGGRVGRATDSQRLALLAMAPDADPVVVISSGVRTTGKEGRVSPAEARPKARAQVAPVKPDLAKWAVQPRLPVAPVRTSSERAKAFAMVRSKPDFVYTDGFRQGNPGEDPHHFTGSAVTFLAMARFETN
jgi:uncharacterized protein YcbK (DUF882 family)